LEDRTNEYRLEQRGSRQDSFQEMLRRSSSMKERLAALEEEINEMNEGNTNTSNKSDLI
jgi:hypothetical protein